MEPDDTAERLDRRRKALQEFPAVPTEYMRGGAQWVSDTVHALAEELHPMLKGIPRRSVSELPDLPDEAGLELHSPDYRQFSHEHEATMSLDVALHFDVGSVLSMLLDLSESLGSQQSAAMLQMMNDAAEASGNVIRSDGDFYESFIAALQSMDIDLFDREEPNLSLVVSPELGRWLRENPPTEEQTRRVDEVLAAKREESRASRSRRRLS